jgi:hypothetical protein
MSQRDHDLDPRVGVEQDRIRDPERPDSTPTHGVGSKLDAVAERAAGHFTTDRQSEFGREGEGLERHASATPETGRGTTVTLDADVEKEVAPGDEIWVHVPPAGRRGWTYDLEGDESVLDVEERAEILRGTTHEEAPDGTGFVVRAERPGRVAVRFEPVDDAGMPPRRLRVTVR